MFNKLFLEIKLTNPQEYMDYEQQAYERMKKTD